MLESIVGATEAGIILLDTSGRSVFTNPAAMRLLRSDGALPRPASAQLAPMLARVRATSAPIISRWSYRDLALRARLRPLSFDEPELLMLELTVCARTADAASLVDTLAASLHMSGRDARLAALVWRGLSNDAIGDALGIPEGTVKSRLYRLYRRYGFGSRRGAMLAVADVINSLGTQTA